MTKTISELPDALEHRDEIARRLAGKRLAVFLDYDGTLTPIVARPDLAVLSDAMRQVVRDLAGRCTVAIVSGRDREDVQKLVALDQLIYAGDHGFDISGPAGLSIRKDAGADFADLMDDVKGRLHRELDGVEGVLIEPKMSSAAVHYRLVAEADHGRVQAVVEAILADHAELRVTPGKMVYEIQPKLDWDKGRAVLWLLEALELDSPDVVPLYLGDDVTDEDAFRALSGRGLGIYVGESEEPAAERPSAADYIVADTAAAGRFLETLGA